MHGLFVSMVELSNLKDKKWWWWGDMKCILWYMYILEYEVYIHFTCDFLTIPEAYNWTY